MGTYSHIELTRFHSYTHNILTLNTNTPYIINIAYMERERETHRQTEQSTLHKKHDNCSILGSYHVYACIKEAAKSRGIYSWIMMQDCTQRCTLSVDVDCTLHLHVNEMAIYRGIYSWQSIKKDSTLTYDVALHSTRHPNTHNTCSATPTLQHTQCNIHAANHSVKCLIECDMMTCT